MSPVSLALLPPLYTDITLPQFILILFHIFKIIVWIKVSIAFFVSFCCCYCLLVRFFDFCSEALGNLLNFSEPKFRPSYSEHDINYLLILSLWWAKDSIHVRQCALLVRTQTLEPFSRNLNSGPTLSYGIIVKLSSIMLLHENNADDGNHDTYVCTQGCCGEQKSKQVRKFVTMPKMEILHICFL